MSTLAGDTYTITVHDPRDDTDDELAERVEFGNQAQREGYPDDPPTTFEDALAAERALPERIRRWSFRARDVEGRLIGVARAALDPEHDENPDVLDARLTVLPADRRHGVGTRLLAEVVHLAKAEGRIRLLGWTSDRFGGGSDFCRAVGAHPKLDMHQNSLFTAEVDRALLQSWVDEGPVRASEYELVWWDQRVPDDDADAYARLVMVMNTAPLDDFELNDFTYSASQLREDEAQMQASRTERWLVVARRLSDGALAGFHDLYSHPTAPKLMWVGATGVEPEHRGHALGKWLKAAMTLRVLEERPRVEEIRTGNADSNDAMLGINRAMGYRPVAATAGWELSIERAEEYLLSRGLPAAD